MRGGLLLVALASACSATHPLDHDHGTVTLSGDAPGPLFAVEAPDAGAHQRSSENVSVSMTEYGDPAKGAFVDISVNPDTALTLRATDGSCADTDGVFRCVGNDQGVAQFAVDTQSSSSTQQVQVSASFFDKSALAITVLPPGLPKTTPKFTLTVGQLAGSTQSRVPATYTLFSCTAQPVDPNATWPTPPRQRPVLIAALAPPGDPTAIANAPVVLTSSSPEAQFSTTADCANRSTSLVVTLDANGNASAFACFSAVGGNVTLTATSGELNTTTDSQRLIQVDPEPRFLGVSAINSQVHVGSQFVPMFQLVARDVLGQRIAIPLTASGAGTGSIDLQAVSYTTTDEINPQPTIVSATPTATGTVHLHATPDLAPSLGCDSPDVTILP